MPKNGWTNKWQNYHLSLFDLRSDELKNNCSRSSCFQDSRIHLVYSSSFIDSRTFSPVTHHIVSASNSYLENQPTASVKVGKHDIFHDAVQAITSWAPYTADNSWLCCIRLARNNTIQILHYRCSDQTLSPLIGGCHLLVKTLLMHQYCVGIVLQFQ